jgi:molybdenum cofactor cytidylyltransferase
VTGTARGRGLGVVLLAAGQGRRMGGPNKLLLDMAGAPLVRHGAASLAALLPEAVRVAVVGRDADAVAVALDGLGFAVARDSRTAEGMGASLAVGVRTLPAGLDGVLVALGDMPGPWDRIVPALVAALRAAPDPPWAVVRPVHAGREGHPVLWGAGFRPALEALGGDIGGRDILRAHSDRLIRVPVHDPACTRDIDRPEDLDEDGTVH